MGELKGLESAGIGGDFASAKGMESWQIQRHPSLMRGREISPDAGPVPTEGAGRKHRDEAQRSAGMAWAPRRSSLVEESNLLSPRLPGAARNLPCPG